jgi:hypothetical protein
MSIVDQRYESWTIEIEPSPALAAHSGRWLARWRGDYHKFTQALFYEAVDAIQQNNLRRRRFYLELEEGRARYFFRRDRRTIHITIERIDFFHPDGDFDPDPHDGERALYPFEPLVIDVSHADKRFVVDYIEGVWLQPQWTDSCDRIEPAYSLFYDDNIRISLSEVIISYYLAGPCATRHNPVLKGSELSYAAVTEMVEKAGRWKTQLSTMKNMIFLSDHLVEPIVTFSKKTGHALYFEIQSDAIAINTGGAGMQYDLRFPDIATFPSPARHRHRSDLPGSL